MKRDFVMQSSEYKAMKNAKKINRHNKKKKK
jgi:hypothetical protein